jgi:hypothetical protein
LVISNVSQRILKGINYHFIGPLNPERVVRFLLGHLLSDFGGLGGGTLDDLRKFLGSPKFSGKSKDERIG